jgi:uncharacterized alpha-E superfamily protein
LASLLARSAECVFWLARQVERADSLARILDVNAAFSHGPRGEQNWGGILNLYSCEPAFAGRYDRADAESVLRFFVLDRENPGSIVATITQARENARTLRPLISTEMWEQLNRFYASMRALEARDLMPDRLHALLSSVKEACQTSFGITTETFYRDEAWSFYLLGQQIERADQTTRLLDTKYQTLLPSTGDVGSPLDISQWNALLRSAAGYHAYRRVHPRGLSPARVVGFMLLNERFPRAVRTCSNIASSTVRKLRREHELLAGTASEHVLTSLRDALAAMNADQVIERGLHETLDWIQSELIVATNRLREDFFGHSRQRDRDWA